MKSIFKQISLRTLCTLCTLTVAFFLVFSLGLHTIDFSHAHLGHAQTHTKQQSENTGDVLILGEYTHMTEKKLFLILLIALLLSAGAARLLTFSWSQFRARAERQYIYAWRKIQTLAPPLITHLQQNFSQGILHPKLH
ncbi:MAG: hypothetical protein ACI9VM_000501 [Candidatus Azotimanducaceae bacterium]|jgi:hypothetical protein